MVEGGQESLVFVVADDAIREFILEHFPAPGLEAAELPEAQAAVRFLADEVLEVHGIVHHVPFHEA